MSFADGADFTIDHPERLRGLSAENEYTLVTANKGISGNLPAVNEAVSGWRLVQSGNSIKMKPSFGMMLIIR